MQITRKLLSFIGRVFDKDPRPFLALRLGYAGGMSWRIEEGFLYTTVTGGPGASLAVDLSQYTIAGLVSYLAGQAGYTVFYADGTELSQLSARILVEDSQDIATSNGDHIYGYTNVLWAFFEAAGNELKQAGAAIAEMLKQMSTNTAADMWLDELGGYYAVPRLPGEVDAQYGPRIITEVLRPRANNVAIEEAIRFFTGQDAAVVDVVEWTTDVPTYDGTITHDGTHNYSSGAQPKYGLFDVQYGYDLLNGGSFAEFQQVIRDLIDRLRDAGTHLRALSLTGSAISDTFTSPPTDGDPVQALTVGVPLTDAAVAPTENTSPMVAQLAPLADALTAPADAAELDLDYSTTYNGQRYYDGSVPYASGSTLTEAI